jgi:hypothetical protein
MVRQWLWRWTPRCWCVRGGACTRQGQGQGGQNIIAWQCQVACLCCACTHGQQCSWHRIQCTNCTMPHDIHLLTCSAWHRMARTGRSLHSPPTQQDRRLAVSPCRRTRDRASPSHVGRSGRWLPLLRQAAAASRVPCAARPCQGREQLAGSCLVARRTVGLSRRRPVGGCRRLSGPWPPLGGRARQRHAGGHVAVCNHCYRCCCGCAATTAADGHSSSLGHAIACQA